VHLVGFIIRINHDARSSECRKKPYGEVEAKSHAFLTLALDWKLMAYFMTQHPLNRRLGRLQNWSACFGEEKIS
jgi:hypothetical protein